MEELDSSGLLSITTDVPAVIYVDGKRVGVSPIQKLAVPLGSRTIKAVPAGGRGRTRSVETRVVAGRAREIEILLR
jgi:hypothetical protein